MFDKISALKKIAQYSDFGDARERRLNRRIAEMNRKAQIARRSFQPSVSTNNYGGVQRRLSGHFIGGEPVITGNPLTENQKMVQQFSDMMRNSSEGTSPSGDIPSVGRDLQWKDFSRLAYDIETQNEIDHLQSQIDQNMSTMSSGMMRNAENGIQNSGYIAPSVNSLSNNLFQQQNKPEVRVNDTIF